jgi:membrane-bound lytic murein transglycosylase B
MQRRHAALAALSFCASALGAQGGGARVLKLQDALAKPYGRRVDVVQFAQAIAQEFSLDAVWVHATLAQARFVAQVVQLIMPSGVPVAKNWAAYRSRFIEARRIDAGTRWWRDNDEWLHLAEERFGVPIDIVVGIVGVETFYGRITGNFRVLDALATLSFDFPSGRSDRSAFFRSELAQFLKLAQREGWDPQSIKGSYAGAMGLPQFMPSSVVNYAIDFDDDGRVDLAASGADVVGSVARFLAEHGWRRDMPTHYAVEAPASTLDRAMLLVPDVVPSFSAAQMLGRGAKLPDPALQHEGSLALIELLNGDAAPSYVAGTQNFLALTRYNASSYYAMAVIELGRAIASTVR